MKAFKSMVLFLFYFIFLFNNLFGVIVLLNGPTCSGKSSIAKELCQILGKERWEYIALDNLEVDVADDLNEDWSIDRLYIQLLATR